MNAFRTLHRSIVLLFVVVVIAIVTLVHFSIAKIVAEQSRAQQRSMSPAVTLIIEQLFKPLHVSETLGKSRELIDIMNAEDVDEKQVFTSLARLQQEFGMTFFIAHEEQRIQYNSDGSSIELVEGEVSWYFKYKAIDDDEVADIGKWEDPHFYIDLKMYNDTGKFLGFFGIGKSLSSFINIFKQYKERYGYDFLFVAPDGNIMLSSDPSLMASFSEFTHLNDLPWFAALPEEVRESKDLNNRLITIDNNDYLIAEVSLPHFDWTVYLLSPLSARQAEISHGFIFSVVVLLIVVFALFMLIYNLLYYFRKDIKTDLIIRDSSRLPDKVQIASMYGHLISKHDRLSIVLVDIDKFPEINDTHGRNAGDEVLEKVGDYLSENLDDEFVLGRWSSEEFIILLPDTGPNEAKRLADNLRHGIATLPESSRYPGLTITASFGVSFTASPRPLLEVTGHAEDALYDARRKGNNNVCIDLIE